MTPLFWPGYDPFFKGHGDSRYFQLLESTLPPHTPRRFNMEAPQGTPKWFRLGDRNGRIGLVGAFM